MVYEPTSCWGGTEYTAVLTNRLPSTIIVGEYSGSGSSATENQVKYNETKTIKLGKNLDASIGFYCYGSYNNVKCVIDGATVYTFNCESNKPLAFHITKLEI